jgi:hypothetical protein
MHLVIELLSPTTSVCALKAFCNMLGTQKLRARSYVKRPSSTTSMKRREGGLTNEPTIARHFARIRQESPKLFFSLSLNMNWLLRVLRCSLSDHAK